MLQNRAKTASLQSRVESASDLRAWACKRGLCCGMVLLLEVEDYLVTGDRALDNHSASR